MSDKRTDDKSIQDELDIQLEDLFGKDGSLELDDDMTPSDVQLEPDEPQELGGLEAEHLDVDFTEDADLDIDLGDADVSTTGPTEDIELELELELDEDDVLAATADDSLDMEDLGLALEEDDAPSEELELDLLEDDATGAIEDALGDELADLLELEEDVAESDAGGETVIIDPEEMELILEESDTPVDTTAVVEPEAKPVFAPLEYIGPDDVDDDTTDAFTVTVVKNKATGRYHLKYGENDYGEDSWSTFEGALGALVGELSTWMAPYAEALRVA